MKVIWICKQNWNSCLTCVLATAYCIPVSRLFPEARSLIFCLLIHDDDIVWFRDDKDIGRGFGFGLFILAVTRWQGLAQIVHNNIECGAQMEVCSDGCTLQSQSVLNINLPGIMALLLRPALAEKLGRNFYTCSAQARALIWFLLLQLTFLFFYFQFDK